MPHLGNDLLELLQLPDDISTIITNGEGSISKVLGQERLSRITGEMQIKIALAKIAFAVQYAGDHRDRLETDLGKHIARFERIQSGDSAHGCAHLDSLAERVSRWVVAQNITMAILTAVGLAGIGFAVWAIQEIISRR